MRKLLYVLLICAILACGCVGNKDKPNDIVTPTQSQQQNASAPTVTIEELPTVTIRMVDIEVN